MTFEIQLFIVIAVVGVITALTAVVIACRVRSAFMAAGMLLLALVCIAPSGYLCCAFHPELIDARYRTYKAFYRDIHIGMTREQVFAVMERHYPAEGRRKQPNILGDTAEGLGFFMNPETSSEPNCEGIFLTLEGGRVINKLYSVD